MRARLVKHEVDYYCILNDDGEVIADVNGGDISKISLKNCQVIERGYDLDELAWNSLLKEKPPTMFYATSEFLNGFQKGLQKALELMDDKKFTEEDVRKAIDFGIHIEGGVYEFIDNKYEIKEKKFLQSLQQNEWDVEIEMEWKPFANRCDQCGEGGKYMEIPCDHPSDCLHWSPKLDTDGCIILKRI